MQRSSPSIASLAAALAKAQAELVNPEKSLIGTIRSDRAGGAERAFRYAPLSSGLEIVRKTLGQHEIATQPTPFPASEIRAQVLDRLAHLSATVPSDVELGFHLCYGDWGGRHQIEPVDSGAMVDLCNAIAAQNGTKLSYVHMPVPIARKDPAYFEPLRNLNLASNTQVYLGLVHLQDGVTGARSRIAAAAEFLPEFGIGTECGLGRAKTSEMVVDILALHAKI